ncbi:heterokaryon incompatibility protein-domain-containing protein [Xylaria cf. heliscus]|nr:heterokaryon incompatibility protein-domain-containing protein [Xylaria cf. heliscus]
MSSPQNLSNPCHCQPWHKHCDPTTCSHAKFASKTVSHASLQNFRISGEGGCQTCATIASALSIPKIRDIWQQSIEPAIQAQRRRVTTELRNDEEEIQVELLVMDHENGRRVVRTLASDVSDDWRHFNLWCGGHSGQQKGHCKALPALEHHPVEHTGSARSVEHLKGWIRFCEENHTCCPRDDPVLPARLVKVTEDCVRVVDTQGKRGRYTTLSHRWGSNETFILTRLNTILMADHINWDSIPNTYQEAIEITRLLGIKYIWIDTLCIVQDDAEDWKREAGKMKSVYGSSYLNIAAIQAKDSYGGLFMSSNLGTEYPTYNVPEEPEILIRPQPHLTHRHFGSNYYSMSDSPLMPRGWVLQERILSPRVVYYDADEIKWECEAAIDCQCGGMVVIANFKLDYHASLKRNGNPLPYQWMRISEKYSSLKFTYDSDRLVALSGLAEQGVQSGKGGKYLAGLWERSLEHQLCWEIVNIHRRPEKYLAPSWSWLSVFGTVRYSNRMDFSSECSSIDVKITEVSCTSIEGAVPTTSTSPIVGFLRLKGRGLKMRAELADAGTQSRPPVYCLRSEGGDKSGLNMWVRSDYAMTQEDARAITEVFLLFWGNMWPNQSTFLVLKSASANSHNFERLGIVWFSKGDKAKQLELILAHCKSEDNIVIV